MSYFADNYSELSLTPTGFRNAQLGAIHAVAAYFTLHQKPELADPALVVMPTGSGKTAVLLASAFLLRPKYRVLIVTPSRAVRNQIAQEARSLKTLKRIGALREELEAPRVLEVKRRLDSAEAWHELAGADLIVGTPNSLSPGSFGVVPPPAGARPLFDLVLMDEAHHSPARTWRALLAAFPSAKRLLCTATPFRRDEREIRAHTVYEYPLTQAIEDKIICRLDYVPVKVEKGDDADETLARRAAEVLREEQDKNPSYRLLVRTDRKTHTADLAKVYEKVGLKLRTVHSGHSQRYIDQSIDKLKEGSDLDGLLCVDMLGGRVRLPTTQGGSHSPQAQEPTRDASVHRALRSVHAAW